MVHCLLVVFNNIGYLPHLMSNYLGHFLFFMHLCKASVRGLSRATGFSKSPLMAGKGKAWPLDSFKICSEKKIMIMLLHLWALVGLDIELMFCLKNTVAQGRPTQQQFFLLGQKKGPPHKINFGWNKDQILGGATADTSRHGTGYFKKRWHDITLGMGGEKPSSSFFSRILKREFRRSNILELSSNILKPPHVPDCFQPLWANWPIPASLLPKI